MAVQPQHRLGVLTRRDRVTHGFAGSDPRRRLACGSAGSDPRRRFAGGSAGSDRRHRIACGSPRGRGMRLAGRAGRRSATPQPTRGRVLFVSELQWNVEPGCGLPEGGGGSHRRRSASRVLVGRSGQLRGNGPSALRPGGSPGSARPFPSRSPACHRSAFQPSSDVSPARHRRAAWRPVRAAGRISIIPPKRPFRTPLVRPPAGPAQ